MGLFTEKLKAYVDYIELGGVSEELIKNAETVLGLIFAEEYRNYLLECGIASADGHEFTGLGNSKRLDVIQTTLYERKRNPKIPSDMYVIERIGINNLVIWQHTNGSICQVLQDGMINKIANSLDDYL